MSKLHPAWDQKRKWGDRFDGTLIRELDPMHVIMPTIYPNRCDNETFFKETFDITALCSYVDSLNAREDTTTHAARYTVFHVLVACLLKLLYVRPKLNRFIANRLMYQRNEVTAAFTIKKEFADNGAEALAIVNAMPNDTLATIHQKIVDQISSGRSDKIDKSSESMDIISRMPRRMTRAFARLVGLLDRTGHCPQSLIDTDPFYSSVVLANLGSLGLGAAYHHLTNWGTASLFVTIGQFYEKEVKADDGGTQTRTFVDLGLTLDERLADGYYYAKSLAYLRGLLEHPQLLERPMCEDVLL